MPAQAEGRAVAARDTQSDQGSQERPPVPAPTPSSQALARAVSLVKTLVPLLLWAATPLTSACFAILSLLQSLVDALRDPRSTVRAIRQRPFPFKRLSPAEAQQRIVFNGLGLLLVLVVYTIFPPYISVKRTIVAASDQYLQARRGGQASWAGAMFSTGEYGCTLLLTFNLLEALWSTSQPPMAPIITDSGLNIQLMRPSSPHSRSINSSPIRSPLARSLPTPPSPSAGYSTPTRPSHAHLSATPLRSSPLSSSTSHALNLSTRTRERSGMYFDDGSDASPVKVADRQMQRLRASQGGGQEQQPPAQQQGQAGLGQGGQGQTTAADGGFVVVDKADKDWADNAWKGVKAKRSSGLFGK